MIPVRNEEPVGDVDDEERKREEDSREAIYMQGFDSCSLRRWQLSGVRNRSHQSG